MDSLLMLDKPGQPTGLLRGAEEVHAQTVDGRLGEPGRMY
jgi:hypothetical protein